MQIAKFIDFSMVNHFYKFKILIIIIIGIIWGKLVVDEVIILIKDDKIIVIIMGVRFLGIRKYEIIK